MPKTYGFTKPYLLGQPTNISQGEAAYNSGLTGDSVYEEFDVCELDAQGRLQKVTAPGASTKFCLANKAWAQPFASAIYRDRPEWYRKMETTDNIVFQLSVAWAESLRGAARALIFNSTDKVLEIGSSATSAHVVILAPIFEVTERANDGTGFGAAALQRYEVGDLKVPVICQWVDGGKLA